MWHATSPRSNQNVAPGKFELSQCVNMWWEDNCRFWWWLRCGRHLMETLRFCWGGGVRRFDISIFSLIQIQTCHLSVGPVLDGVRVRDLRLLPLLLLLLLLLGHGAWHHHLNDQDVLGSNPLWKCLSSNDYERFDVTDLFCEGKLANQRAVSTLSLVGLRLNLIKRNWILSRKRMQWGNVTWSRL